jgi:low molecular weight protein-tyrosine phosphatase
MATILLVCTGNICRSPMAEGFLRRELRQRGIDGIRVESSGLSGWDGSGATNEAVEALTEYGLDISGHAAQRLTRDMAEGADLIVAMSAEHREGVSHLVPSTAARTFTIKELVYLLESSPVEAVQGSAAQQLKASVDAATAVRDEAPEVELLDEDIADPLGLGIESFRATAWELEGLSKRLADGLFPGAGRVAVPKEGGARTQFPEGGAG